MPPSPQLIPVGLAVVLHTDWATPPVIAMRLIPSGLEKATDWLSGEKTGFARPDHLSVPGMGRGSSSLNIRRYSRAPMLKAIFVPSGEIASARRAVLDRPWPSGKDIENR